MIIFVFLHPLILTLKERRKVYTCTKALICNKVNVIISFDEFGIIYHWDIQTVCFNIPLHVWSVEIYFLISCRLVLKPMLFYTRLWRNLLTMNQHFSVLYHMLCLLRGWGFGFNIVLLQLGFSSFLVMICRI